MNPNWSSYEKLRRSCSSQPDYICPSSQLCALAFRFVSVPWQTGARGGILNQLFFSRHATSIIEKTKVEAKSLKKATVAWLHLALKFRQGTTAASPACNFSGCLGWLSLTLLMLELGWRVSVQCCAATATVVGKHPNAPVGCLHPEQPTGFPLQSGVHQPEPLLYQTGSSQAGQAALYWPKTHLRSPLMPEHQNTGGAVKTTRPSHVKGLNLPSLTGPLVQVSRTLYVLISLIILCSQTAAVYDIIPTFICSAFVSSSRQILSTPYKQNKD